MRHALALVVCVLLAALSAAQSGPRARLVVGEGLNEPFAVDFDAAGRMFIAEMGGNRVSVWDRSRLTPLATPFTGPHHLLRGPDNIIYVADTWSNVVRRVDPSTGTVTRFAGTGQKGFSGDGGRALDAQFGAVFAIAIHAGTLYIADLDNRRIRIGEPRNGHRRHRRRQRREGRAERRRRREGAAAGGPARGGRRCHRPDLHLRTRRPCVACRRRQRAHSDGGRHRRGLALAATAGLR